MQPSKEINPWPFAFFRYSVLPLGVFCQTWKQLISKTLHIYFFKQSQFGRGEVSKAQRVVYNKTESSGSTTLSRQGIRFWLPTHRLQQQQVNQKPPRVCKICIAHETLGQPAASGFQSLKQSLSPQTYPPKEVGQECNPKKSLLSNAHLGKTIEKRGPGRASQRESPWH